MNEEGKKQIDASLFTSDAGIMNKKD